MNLDYALVTSASLPDQVRDSANYVSLDKAQWLDLIDYSEHMASEDPRAAHFIFNLRSGDFESKKRQIG